MKISLEKARYLHSLRENCLHSDTIKSHYKKIKSSLKPMSYDEFVDSYIIDIYKYETPSSPQRRFLNKFLKYC
jgi:hypothetical protein